jgi:hypothetical protein
MLEKYVQKGIHFKRTQETVNMGFELAAQAAKDESKADPELVQKTKKNVEKIISEYKSIFATSSLWASQQTQLMKELRIKMSAEQSDESKTYDVQA